jgi:hypothetical protein
MLQKPTATESHQATDHERFFNKIGTKRTSPKHLHPSTPDGKGALLLTTPRQRAAEGVPTALVP